MDGRGHVVRRFIVRSSRESDDAGRSAMIGDVWGVRTSAVVRLVATSVLSVGIGVVLFVTGNPGAGAAMTVAAAGPACALWMAVRRARIAGQPTGPQ
jgi:hypothetical protein